MTRDIVPVIMGGGKGTRLWPLSRALAPKQFIGDKHFFQEARVPASQKCRERRSWTRQRIGAVCRNSKAGIPGVLDNQDGLAEAYHSMVKQVATRPWHRVPELAP